MEEPNVMHDMYIKNATQEFIAALDAFVRATQYKINTHYANNLSMLTPPTLTAEPGSKNVKIVSNESNGNRSVFCFVRIADGAVLKAASWKTPAKHERGSIYVGAGQDAVTVYGAKYL